MIGTAEVTRWRTVAADVDGTPAPELTGQITEVIEARFAYEIDAHVWAIGLEETGEGWGDLSLASTACAYFGPTDAPGNCWTARLERIIEA